ncbi:MAG: spermidine synthase [Planctomycetota bacterium]|jgi:spermidine synthase
MARLWRRSALALVLFVAAGFGLLIAGGAAGSTWGTLVYQKNSLYHRIFVYQQGSIVTLQFGTHAPLLVQSQVDLTNLRRHVTEYSALAFCGLLYKPEPANLLVVGLGGGVIPREMRHYFPELEIDVVEIDPEILPIAESYFRFRTDEKLKVHIADGRMFVKRQRRGDPAPRYDLVVLDAFNSDYIPFHLMTKEFLEEVQGVLAEDGVVVANVFHTNLLCDAELKTFLAVFGRCQVFFGAYSTNAMLVAPGPAAPELTVKEAVKRATELQTEHGFAFDMRSVAVRLSPDARPAPNAQVLTDDRAPVNWLRRQETQLRPGRSQR